MNLILFILACWGMTQILVYGEIFDPIRPKHKFFHCPMCVGFHVGWFVFILFRHLNMWSKEDFLIWAFVAGCISSATSEALAGLFNNGLVVNSDPTEVTEIIERVDGMTDEEVKDELREISLD